MKGAFYDVKKPKKFSSFYVEMRTKKTFQVFYVCTSSGSANYKFFLEFHFFVRTKSFLGKAHGGGSNIFCELVVDEK